MNTMRVNNDGGSIAVEVHGDGPLVLCVPGMGESRSSFRHLSLAESGFRVAIMDLRGHGDSSVDFEDYDDPATARDILAVISHLGGPATVIGNSMGAAAAVIAATEYPDAVNGLVLIGPFVRDHGPAAALRFALMKPWGPIVWTMYHRKLFGDITPDDHAEHLTLTRQLLKRPGRWRAFERTARTSHTPAEAALPKVNVPTLVIMGDKDPDFRDPEVEAIWVAGNTRGRHTMIPGARHYPMAEQPEAVMSVITPFLKEITNG